MLKPTNPKIRRNDVMIDSFNSCISDTSSFSWAPEMSLSKVFSKPRMFPKEFKSGTGPKQLDSLACENQRRHSNKEMSMVDSDMQFIDFIPMSSSNFSQKQFAINSDQITLERVLSIFWSPSIMENILSERVSYTFHIYSLSSKDNFHYLQNVVHEPNVSARCIQEFKKVKFSEDGSFSLCVKEEVFLSWM